MYSVMVKGHMMIAHSFTGEMFGPAQKLHGATYVAEVEFRSPTLDANGVVVDIGRAEQVVESIFASLSYRNLDDESEFKGHNTTTEFLSRVVFDRVAAAIAAGELGRPPGDVQSLRVTLHESHVASASYEGAIRAS
ncbi:MAG TPA: 6-carboxytetrahydropterin synthase [Vicinamibacterales bacterium]|jgi:6-pyruvoyl-tetrahydropterin synthase